MLSCSKCSNQVPDGSRFCPHCAAAVDSSSAATRTSIPQQGSHATSSSLPSLDHGRFLPGSMVGNRYRIIGLLGRGGMGEVYRADDLKLGQPVALKFLPAEVAGNPDRLRRFHHEVRMALRITHANVCRVYDIGEVDGQHFISMEYVDGEDLASLLRRIGRLPEDRGVAIARQLCAGLAAAHEKGILHRDLKPANIMIDGRGRARITDFGLADMAGTVDQAEIRAGTPTYMAPEQLAGKDVSVRSDIYSLGLVLYEMFTGKAVFKATSVTEMQRLHQSSTPSSPSSLVKGLDSALEGAILRAMDPDPSRRPSSALALAAALPGGDTLAAALAAGETPSPEMVADAGEAGGMAPGWVVLSLFLILGGMALSIWLALFASGRERVERPLSLMALNERARLMVERLGHDQYPVDRAYGLTSLPGYTEWLREKHAEDLRQKGAVRRPSALLLWYRQSPVSLAPWKLPLVTTMERDPPLTRPGMVSIWLDQQARLVQLTAVPPTDLSGYPASEPAWGTLFKEAGLDLGDFTAVEPRLAPKHFVDSLAAWEGAYPETPEVKLHIEAAARGSLPVWFRLSSAGSATHEDENTVAVINSYVELIVVTISLSMLAGLVVLGRRIMRQGRGDGRGAFRVAAFIFCVRLVAWVVESDHFSGAFDWVVRTFVSASVTLLLSGTIFLAYMVLEPYVRRLWPEVLISWSRLLGGRLRDPMVGRDLLMGALAGILTRLVVLLHAHLTVFLWGPSEPLKFATQSASWISLHPVATVLNALGGIVGDPLSFLVALVVLRYLVRRTWLAVAIFFVFSVGPWLLGSSHLLLDMGLHTLTLAIIFVVLLRIGLLAGVSLWLFEGLLKRVQTVDPAAWEGPLAMVSGLLLLLVTAYAVWVALGGRSLMAADSAMEFQGPGAVSL